MMESILGSIGLKSILPISATEIFRNLELYQREKNLIAWNFVNPERQRESLDIILTEDVRNCKIEQAKTDFGSLPAISLEDLIRMKSKTNRAQDIEDVRALRKVT
ncbi:hypothetical protein [Leptospira biflexa]|uniref:hypothetical protein n=1 Tax=Leptospira biflexa TaxID=172 RepID=UPI001FED5586|nr:hypothetical protein [Leptospira biflexa]